jgi:RimJ/RimL family protein N-acetyltransferase
VWEWIQPFRRRVCDDFAPKTRSEFTDVYLQRMEAPHITSWGVWRDGELGGVIWFERVGIAGIVHVVVKRSFWGAETTGPALSAVATEIFAEGSGVRKIGALFFADNHAVRAAVQRFGFQREGLLRAQTLRDGQPVDMEPWGLLKEEFVHGNRSGNGSADREPGGNGGVGGVRLHGGEAEDIDEQLRTGVHAGAGVDEETDGGPAELPDGPAGCGAVPDEDQGDRGREQDVLGRE